MNRRFVNKLIRILLGLGLAGSTTLAVSIFNGCERDEVKAARMLIPAEDL